MVFQAKMFPIELGPSFFTGVWGLFVLFGITNSNGLLIQHQFVKKALVLKIPMVLINIQVKCTIKISFSQVSTAEW